MYVDIISEEEFAKIDDVGTAFIRLQTQLTPMIGASHFTLIRRACLAQMKMPGGVTLSPQLVAKIQNAQNVDMLLDELAVSPYWSWIDIRLLQAIVVACQSPKAFQLLQNYKRAIFSRKLIDVLPNIPSKEIKDEYYSKLVAKLAKEPESMTIADLLKFQTELEKVIMDIGNGVCVLEHIRKGCIEVHFYIAIHYIKRVHQSASARCHMFIKMHLLWMQIGHCPKIHNPLSSPKIVLPAMQTLNSGGK